MDVITDKCEVTPTVLDRVRGIMRREWRCVFDSLLLEGMLYESMLGRYMAGMLTIAECREMAAELGLPRRAEIMAAAREAVHSWGED